MSNVFYTDVLQSVQKLLSDNMKGIPVRIGAFKGSTSVRLLPASQEQISKTVLSVFYRNFIFIAYKTNKKLDIRQLTQESYNIKTILDQNPDYSVNNILKFYDGNVHNIDYLPEIEDGEVEIDFVIEFSCTTSEIFN